MRKGKVLNYKILKFIEKKTNFDYSPMIFEIKKTLEL